VCLIYSSITSYRIFVGKFLQNGQLQCSEEGRRIRIREISGEWIVRLRSESNSYCGLLCNQYDKGIGSQQAQRFIRFPKVSRPALTRAFNISLVGEVECLTLLIPKQRPPLWSSGQSSLLQIQRSRVRFTALPDFLRSSRPGTGSTQPREDN
jgi:hypothetical protein